MTDALAYAFLLPTGIVIATLYSSTGISGASFWTPVYVLWLGLAPRVGFWIALLTMLFGSLGGLVGHWRQGTVRASLAKRDLAVAIPVGIAGGAVSHLLSPLAMVGAFGVLVLVYAAVLALRRDALDGAGAPPTSLAALVPVAVGGVLVGVLSAGLGMLLLPRNLRDPRFRHHAEAVGTTLLVVFLASVAAALGRLTPDFVATLAGSAPDLMRMAAWAIPGVLIGGQLGPALVRRISRATLRAYVVVLLGAIGALMLSRAALGWG